jgi:hypothetical protein
MIQAIVGWGERPLWEGEELWDEIEQRKFV